MSPRWFALMIAGGVACGGGDKKGNDEHAKTIEAQRAEHEAVLARPNEVRVRLTKARDAAATAADKVACTKATGKKALFVERELLEFLVTGTPAIDLDKEAGNHASIDDWTSLSSAAAHWLRKYDWHQAMERKYPSSTSDDRAKIARDINKLLDTGLGDLVVVVDARTKTRPITSGPTFEAGKLAGRALAINPVAGTAVCSVAFSATSSDVIEVRTGSVGGVAVTEDGPLGDLTGNARKQILVAFGKAGLGVDLVP